MGPGCGWLSHQHMGARRYADRKSMHVWAHEAGGKVRRKDIDESKGGEVEKEKSRRARASYYHVSRRLTRQKDEVMVVVARTKTGGCAACFSEFASVHSGEIPFNIPIWA
jgi:hypothetical protein